MSVKFVQEYWGKMTQNETYQAGAVGTFSEDAEKWLIAKGVAVHVAGSKPLAVEVVEPEPVKPKPKRVYTKR
jgi:hypothetical protein